MEENNTPNSSEDTTDVNKNNENNSGDKNNETFEVSKEDYEKLQELERNKTIGLKKAQEENKTLKEKLALIEAKEKEAENEEKRKQGKYEELLSEANKTIEELTGKATAYDKLITEIEEKETNQINDLKSKIGDEIFQKNSFIFDDLSSNGKKIKFLETLIPKTEEKQNFNNKAKGKNPGDVSEFDLLKTKVLGGKATPSERGKYISLLKSKNN